MRRKPFDWVMHDDNESLGTIQFRGNELSGLLRYSPNDGASFATTHDNDLFEFGSNDQIGHIHGRTSDGRRFWIPNPRLSISHVSHGGQQIAFLSHIALVSSSTARSESLDPGDLLTTSISAQLDGLADWFPHPFKLHDNENHNGAPSNKAWGPREHRLISFRSAAGEAVSITCNVESRLTADSRSQIARHCAKIDFVHPVDIQSALHRMYELSLFIGVISGLPPTIIDAWACCRPSNEDHFLSLSLLYRPLEIQNNDRGSDRSMNFRHAAPFIPSAWDKWSHASSSLLKSCELMFLRSLSGVTSTDIEMFGAISALEGIHRHFHSEDTVDSAQEIDAALSQVRQFVDDNIHDKGIAERIKSRASYASDFSLAERLHGLIHALPTGPRSTFEPIASVVVKAARDYRSEHAHRLSPAQRNVSRHPHPAVVCEILRGLLRCSILHYLMPNCDNMEACLQNSILFVMAKNKCETWIIS